MIFISWGVVVIVELLDLSWNSLEFGIFFKPSNLWGLKIVTVFELIGDIKTKLSWNKLIH
jgi:hypothetical protein